MYTRVLEQWVAVTQMEVVLSSWPEENAVKSIAVYGMGKIGQLFVNMINILLTASDGGRIMPLLLSV